MFGNIFRARASSAKKCLISAHLGERGKRRQSLGAGAVGRTVRTLRSGLLRAFMQITRRCSSFWGGRSSTPRCMAWRAKHGVAFGCHLPPSDRPFCAWRHRGEWPLGSGGRKSWVRTVPVQSPTCHCHTPRPPPARFSPPPPHPSFSLSCGLGSPKSSTPGHTWENGSRDVITCPLIIETGGTRTRGQDPGCWGRDAKSQLVAHPQAADEHAGVLHRELPLPGHDALDGFEDVGGHGDIPTDVNVAPLLLQGSVHSFRQLLLQDILYVLLQGMGGKRTGEKVPGWVMLTPHLRGAEPDTGRFSR